MKQSLHRKFSTYIWRKCRIARFVWITESIENWGRLRSLFSKTKSSRWNLKFGSSKGWRTWNRWRKSIVILVETKTLSTHNNWRSKSLLKQWRFWTYYWENSEWIKFNYPAGSNRVWCPRWFYYRWSFKQECNWISMSVTQKI